MEPGENQQEPVERQRALDWLEQKWRGDRRCPVCQTNQWSIGDVVEVRPFTGGGLTIGGPLYPLFFVTCVNCGYTLTFNALISGVVQQAVEPETPAP